MPELPEVETVVRDLRPLLIGRRIDSIHAGRKRLRRPWQSKWSKTLIGSQFTGVSRRGKWILLRLDSPHRLLVHLGMTGQFTAVPGTEPLPDHVHLRFDLHDGTQLRFRDVRRFGSVDLFPSEETVTEFLTERLGPEPAELETEYFRGVLRNSRRTLKAILLDQSVIAGVGNIYADESLFRAGLHPERRGNSVTSLEAEQLRQSIIAVIAHAIENRGSTIRDYIGGSGLRGNFQHEFQVYGRTGDPCPKCSNPIAMVRVAGRSSHFCGKCQK